MEITWRHGWDVSIKRAIELQKELATQVLREGDIKTPRFIAGVDVSVNRAAKTGSAAVVVISYPELELIEVETVAKRVEFPYVPGLLSFREAPLILAACEKLSIKPDLMIVDGQGIAHPRRMGLASHIGFFLDIPTIGCAKSRLTGAHEELDNEIGDCVELRENGEVIGMVVRTRRSVKPVYVSIGHKISLSSAVHWVLACCRGYRLPEPTRMAHMAAGGNLKMTGMRV